MLCCVSCVLQLFPYFKGKSVQERVETDGGTEKRGKKRSTNPPSLKGNSPGKKIAKVEPAAVKVPDYAELRDVDDESARVST